MNYPRDIHFKKEPKISTCPFSWRREKNWLSLWINNIHFSSCPLTYTLEECLEESCEGWGQISRGVSFTTGFGVGVKGWGEYEYRWRQP